MWISDNAPAIESDFSVFHRIDNCWEDMDVRRFMRLVALLPAYDGATRRFLAMDQEKSTPARATQSAPTTRHPTAPHEPVREVPLEAMNATVGLQVGETPLISFGSAG